MGARGSILGLLLCVLLTGLPWSGQRPLQHNVLEFRFEPVTASHLKIKLLLSFKGDSYILAHEFQLFGK